MPDMLVLWAFIICVISKFVFYHASQVLPNCAMVQHKNKGHWVDHYRKQFVFSAYVLPIMQSWDQS